MKQSEKRSNKAFCTFSAFCTQNFEKADFDQPLEFATAKPWLKYTTNDYSIPSLPGRLLYTKQLVNLLCVFA